MTSNLNLLDFKKESAVQIQRCVDASAKEQETGAFFFFTLTSAWQQKEMHDKNIAKIKLWVAVKIYLRH